MYRAFSESRKNKNTSASNDELNNESTTDEPNDFFFDVIPGNIESSLKGVMEQTMAMDLPSLRQMYRRLVKISDVNEELTLYLSERLDTQDRIAEAKMATSEAVQLVNDNWTKRLSNMQSLHGKYRDEEIRITREHLTHQTESQLLEERNEALQLEIRSIVLETEEIRRRRDAFEENMFQDKEEVSFKAGELVKENEKTYQSIAALRAELNSLNIGLLNDDELASRCGEDIDESDTVLKETGAGITTCVRTDVDIDLINIGCHEPEIDTPCITNNCIHTPNGNCSNFIVDTIEDTVENKDNISMGKTLQGTRKVESEAKFHKLNNYTVFEKENRGRQLLELSVGGLYLDNYQVATGINTKSIIMPDVLRNTTESGDSDVKVSQSQQIDRRLPCLDKLSEATNISNRGGSIVNARTKTKHCIRDTRKHRNLTKIVPKTDENIKQKHISLIIRPKTGPVIRLVPLQSSSKLGISSSKESIYVSPPETRITDESRQVKTAHGADTPVDNISNVRSLMKKQLPSISRADIKRKTKRCLEMYSVYVENALPSISPHTTTTENGVICDVLVSSPRPLFTTRTDSTCKTRPSLDKAETTCSIKPSLRKVDTAGNTTHSLGKVDTTRNTTPSLCKVDTTRYTIPSIGKLVTTLKTRPSLCKTGTSCNIKPSLGKRKTTYNLKPSLGKRETTYNLKPSLGKADTTCSIKSPVESGYNGTPKTSSVEVKPCVTETYIQLSGNKKLLSKRD